MRRSIKDAAKRSDTATCKMLAKEVVRSRKVQTRLHTSKAQMNSVVMQMENQLGKRCAPHAQRPRFRAPDLLAGVIGAHLRAPRSALASQPSTRSPGTCRRAQR